MESPQVTWGVRCLLLYGPAGVSPSLGMAIDTPPEDGGLASLAQAARGIRLEVNAQKVECASTTEALPSGKIGTRSRGAD